MNGPDIAAGPRHPPHSLRPDRPDRPDRVYSGYVFDLDGTLYLGEAPIPGAAATIARLRDAGARILFVTNNPTHLPATYAAKLTDMGIPAIREDVVTSTDSLLRYLRIHAPGARVLPIGEPLLHNLLADDGVGLQATQQHRSMSHGLLGMRERLVALGGTFDIRGDAGQGTKLNATFPVVESDPSPE